MRFDTAGPLLRGVGPALGALAELWPLWLMMLALGLVAMTLTRYRDWQDDREYRASGLAEIDQMDPYHFEHYVAWLFQQLGYKTDVTKKSRDQGVDVVVTKGRQKIAVQAKRYSDTVGNDAVQQVAAGRPHYRCNGAIVVANQAFSPDARALAKSNDVQLWDREILAQVIKAVRQGKAEPVFARLNSRTPAASRKPRRQQVLPKDEQAKTPECPRCGGSMERRKLQDRQVWVCATFPVCTGHLMGNGAS